MHSDFLFSRPLLYLGWAQGFSIGLEKCQAACIQGAPLREPPHQVSKTLAIWRKFSNTTRMSASVLLAHVEARCPKASAEACATGIANGNGRRQMQEALMFAEMSRRVQNFYSPSPRYQRLYNQSHPKILNAR